MDAVFSDGSPIADVDGGSDVVAKPLIYPKHASRPKHTCCVLPRSCSEPRLYTFVERMHDCSISRPATLTLHSPSPVAPVERRLFTRIDTPSTEIQRREGIVDGLRRRIGSVLKRQRTRPLPSVVAGDSWQVWLSMPSKLRLNLDSSVKLHVDQLCATSLPVEARSDPRVFKSRAGPSNPDPSQDLVLKCAET